MAHPTSRRSFLQSAGLGATALSIGAANFAAAQQIQGFEKQERKDNPKKVWQPVSDRKIRMGIAGFGVCRFGAAFSLQHHPNVEVVAVSDLFPERCQALAKACRCEKTYPSLEEMVKDDSIEAIFVATDAPSHARHCIEVLKHGKHVATAVPAVWEHLELADELYETVEDQRQEIHDVRDLLLPRRSACHARDLSGRRIRQTRVQRRVSTITTSSPPIPSYKDWRMGVPPQWYPTHSNAYYVCVTGGSFTEVSCMGMPSTRKELQPENNATRIRSAPRSPCSAPATAAWRGWQSVGTHRDSGAKWDASAANLAR